MPAATPTKSSSPEVPPNGVALVVGGPPSEEAGCEGGGASVALLKIHKSFKINAALKTKLKIQENETCIEVVLVFVYSTYCSCLCMYAYMHIVKMYVMYIK